MCLCRMNCRCCPERCVPHTSQPQTESDGSTCSASIVVGGLMGSAVGMMLGGPVGAFIGSFIGVGLGHDKLCNEHKET